MLTSLHWLTKLAASSLTVMVSSTRSIMQDVPAEDVFDCKINGVDAGPISVCNPGVMQFRSSQKGVRSP